MSPKTAMFMGASGVILVRVPPSPNAGQSASTGCAPTRAPSASWVPNCLGWRRDRAEVAPVVANDLIGARGTRTEMSNEQRAAEQPEILQKHDLLQLRSRW